MPRALITGITGQDGSYLAELLLQKGYVVFGLARRVAGCADQDARFSRIWHLLDQIEVITGSVCEYTSVLEAVRRSQPDEVYHLAAQSHVGTSFGAETTTMATNIGGTHHVLMAVKALAPAARVYFAGSSEQFGNATVSPQDEATPFSPVSVYGISKVAGFELTQHYRERHGLHACSGILFNHESERRGCDFVTRTITRGVARIKAGQSDRMPLGSLDAARDWGYAPDYVEAMWLMLQRDEPDDFVIATGESHTVYEFARLAFEIAGLEVNAHIWTDPDLKRPTELWRLRGDASKAQRLLGWRPRVRFEELVRRMVKADLEALGA